MDAEARTNLIQPSVRAEDGDVPIIPTAPPGHRPLAGLTGALPFQHKRSGACRDALKRPSRAFRTLHDASLVACFMKESCSRGSSGDLWRSTDWKVAQE